MKNSASELYKTNNLTIKECISFFTIGLYGPLFVLLLWPVGLFFLRGDESVKDYLKTVKERLHPSSWLDYWAIDIRIRVAQRQLKELKAQCEAEN